MAEYPLKGVISRIRLPGLPISAHDDFCNRGGYDAKVFCNHEFISIFLGTLFYPSTLLVRFYAPDPIFMQFNVPLWSLPSPTIAAQQCKGKWPLRPPRVGVVTLQAFTSPAGPHQRVPRCRGSTTGQWHSQACLFKEGGDVKPAGLAVSRSIQPCMKRPCAEANLRSTSRPIATTTDEQAKSTVRNTTFRVNRMGI